MIVTRQGGDAFGSGHRLEHGPQGHAPSMWMPNLAGPFIFDPDEAAPAVDLEEWETTWDYRERHKPTGCEFRTVLTERGHYETWLKLTYLPRTPPPERLRELAHASQVAGAAILRERVAFGLCDAQNRAERVPPWV